MTRHTSWILTEKTFIPDDPYEGKMGGGSPSPKTIYYILDEENKKVDFDDKNILQRVTKCVNAHDGLVAALRKAKEEMYNENFDADYVIGTIEQALKDAGKAV